MVILSDFDDTASSHNTAELLLTRYASSIWRELRQRFRNGEITLREYQEQAFASVTQSRESLQQYVCQEAVLRNGFVDLVLYCRQNSIELAIVTYGLDFYVEALLKKYGIEDVPYYAVETNFTGGEIGYTYRYTTPGCNAWGNCKCRVLEKYRQEGHEIFYAGDGTSDACPAAKSDFVFARAHLLRCCQQNNIPHRELSDFYDVINELTSRGYGTRPGAIKET